MSKNQTIQHKRSAVASNQPSTSQVATGELAINFADKSIYTKTPTNTIIELERDVIKSGTQPSSPVDGDMWYDTANDSLYLWDGTAWVRPVYSGKSVLPANTTASPTWSSGAGTQASPYVFTITSSPGSKSLVTAVTVTGLAPNQFVPITDSNSATNGARFTFTNNLADASGVLVFNIIFNDVPTGTGGTTYTANIRVGTGTVYIDVTATLVSVGPTFPQSVNFPTNTGSVTTSWTSAADTLTSTGDLRISLDGVTFSTGPLSITTGATLHTKWTGGPGTGLGIDGTHGSAIIGAVESSNGASTSSSLTIDKTPAAITFPAVTGAALSTATDSSTQMVSGVNSYVYLTSGNTVSASVAGGTFGAVPTSGTSLYVVSGQTLQLRQTSSATSATTTTVSVTAGGGTTSFAVTTAAAGTINTPTITSPINNSTGILSTATLTSSTYAVTGAVGTHLSTDWEIYSNGTLTTLVTSSIGDTTNLTTWTPTGLTGSKSYWVRVRYTSNDGTAIVSSYSTAVKWTTAALLGTTWTGRGGYAATGSVVWGGSSYVVVAEVGKCYTSPDGITWTEQTGLATAASIFIDWYSVTWSSTLNLFVAVGENGACATSPDGVTWTSQPSLATAVGATTAMNEVTWSSTLNLFVAVGANGACATSPDGTNWTNRTSLATATGANMNSVTWSSALNLFMAVGDSGKGATSPDGVTWTNRPSFRTAVGTTAVMNSVAWSSTLNLFVAVGDTSDCATSPDGITWTSRASLATVTTSTNMNSVIWAGGQFVTVGEASKAATSLDGITWVVSTNYSTANGTITGAFSIASSGTQLVVKGNKKFLTSP